MEEIKNKSAFQHTLKDVIGKGKFVRIIKKNDEEIFGTIIDYIQGGYKMFGEIIPAEVRIGNSDGINQVHISDIEELFIEKKGLKQ